MAAALGVLLIGGCQVGLQVEEEQVAVEPAMSEDELERYAIAEGRLASADRDVRQKAAIELLGMKDPHALAPVLERMRQAPDPTLRVDMIEAAAFCKDHRCFGAILDALKDEDPAVKQAAASALGRFSDPQEVEAMMKVVSESSRSPAECELLFEALGEGLCVRAIPVLLEGLEGDRPAVREAAWRALKQVSGRDFPPQTEPWKDWWASNKHRTREDVLEERVWSLERSVEAGRHRNEELREQLAELYALMMSPAAGTPQGLLEALRSRHPRVREYASLRLASLEPEALSSLSLDDWETYEALGEALAAHDPQLRERVVRFIAKLKGRFRSPLLLSALDDEDPNVLLEALDAVSGEIDAAAVPRLEAALGNRHPEVREKAVKALGKVGSERAVELLLTALSDEEEDVRWIAVDALCELRAAVAVPQLCELLGKDPSPLVRQITATTLGELGQPAAIPALREALKDENKRVRTCAVSALGILAKDSFERMIIIADILAGEGHSGAAAEVLRKAIADFGHQEALEGQLRAARVKLAEALKAEKDFLGAAAAYAELDRSAGGDMSVRAELIGCWLAGAEPGRIITAMEEWLEQDGEGRRPEIVELGLRAARKLAGNDQERLAQKLLDVLLKAAQEADDEALVEKIEKLKGQAPPVPERAPPD